PQPGNSSMTISPHDIARVLSEALPHMQRYDQETVVVKYGGHAMGEEDMAKSFARDIVLMEQTAINPVVVHGGGPQIGEMLKRLGIKSEFAGGLRITDAATIEIVEMVLAGSINKQLSPDDARELIADGTISGGMIPKVETCIYALEAGVEGVVILDGKVPHAVLLELLTDHGAGTLMMR